MCWRDHYTCLLLSRSAYARGGESARREGRGCRIAGRGLVFTLISHRVSRGCQTLRPPPRGAPSFHRIRTSFTCPCVPSLLFSLYIFLFSRLVPRTKATLPNCAHRSSCTKARMSYALRLNCCHNISSIGSHHTCLYFCEIKKQQDKSFNFIDFIHLV